MSLDTSSAALPPSVVSAGAPLFLLSPEKYRAMVRDGILTEDDPVEYLQGVLVEKMTKSDRHVAVVWLLRRWIESILAAGYFTLTQDPIDLGHSQPEPDIAVLRGDPQSLFRRKPTASDIALVVEVSDSTLRRDRELKRAIYAAAGIASYWIVNLVDNVVEVYDEPDAAATPGSYRQSRRLGPGDSLVLNLEGQAHQLEVKTVLGV